MSSFVKPISYYLKNSFVTKRLSQGKTLRAKAQMQKPCFQAISAQDKTLRAQGVVLCTATASKL